MTVVEDLRNDIPLREISRISGIFPFPPSTTERRRGE